ncbi:unnamed protein product [Didymodactylos carnosus]|uniref:Uncharacterized protein n=1 Tax=Didymodactylos carnosus TaxID=1234261 RepID=A0A8S2FH10_9BILA|nr:unnamed protein product [Didymodactylos carnosus]CAF4255305.1 unnamed protein product [Didymodactylos carnosus]
MHLLEDMRLRRFDNYARIIQKAMKRFCAVRVYQRQREQATDLLYDKKERNARSLDRDYLGDYCNLHLRPDLQKLVPRNEKNEFSSYLYKYDRRFRRQGRYLIVTNQAIYLIDEECVKVGNAKSGTVQSKGGRQQEGFMLRYIVKRRIPLETITEIKMSEYRDNFFLLCVSNDYASLLELSSKTECCSIISKNYMKKTNRTLNISFGQGFDYTVKKQKLSAGGTRSLKFLHAATNALLGTSHIDTNKLKKATDMPRNYDVKINGKTMTVMVSSGLPKNSRPNQANAERPQGLQFKSQNNLTKNGKSASCPPIKPPRPLASKQPKQKRLLTLYDFTARSADELSFPADVELLLVDNSDSTWWKAEYKGLVGVVPSNYVEIIN